MTLDELRESLSELAFERHYNGITDRFAELVASIRARRPTTVFHAAMTNRHVTAAARRTIAGEAGVVRVHPR